jgi:hypothetical protein
VTGIQREQYPEDYQYSQFCELYRRYRAKLDYCMRQDHHGGEKLFVDYGEGLCGWLFLTRAMLPQKSGVSWL